MRQTWSYSLDHFGPAFPEQQEGAPPSHRNLHYSACARESPFSLARNFYQLRRANSIQKSGGECLQRFEGVASTRGISCSLYVLQSAINIAKRHRFLSDIADKQQMGATGGTHWDVWTLSVSWGAPTNAPQRTPSLAVIPGQFTHVSWSNTHLQMRPGLYHQPVIRPKELGSMSSRRVSYKQRIFFLRGFQSSTMPAKTVRHAAHDECISCASRAALHRRSGIGRMSFGGASSKRDRIAQ